MLVAEPQLPPPRPGKTPGDPAGHPQYVPGAAWANIGILTSGARDVKRHASSAHYISTPAPPGVPGWAMVPLIGPPATGADLPALGRTGRSVDRGTCALAIAPALFILPNFKFGAGEMQQIHPHILFERSCARHRLQATRPLVCAGPCAWHCCNRAKVRAGLSHAAAKPSPPPSKTASATSRLGSAIRANRLRSIATRSTGLTWRVSFRMRLFRLTCSSLTLAFG